MKVKRFIGGSLESNGYVLYNAPGGESYIVDPGYNPKVFIDFIRDNELILKGILLTHNHHDHVGAVDAVADTYSCPVYMHIKDAERYKGKVDVEIEDGFTFGLDGKEEIITLSTPGHTQGSVCFMCEKSKICFTGDTIFDTDLGRTDLSGGSEEDMRWSMVNVVDNWSNDIFIYPGHDNGCTMKQVRKYNTEFLALIRGENR